MTDRVETGCRCRYCKDKYSVMECVLLTFIGLSLAALIIGLVTV